VLVGRNTEESLVPQEYTSWNAGGRRMDTVDVAGGEDGMKKERKGRLAHPTVIQPIEMLDARLVLDRLFLRHGGGGL
jgi:hypothetical protein